jgi:hypothetical protein
MENSYSNSFGSVNERMVKLHHKNGLEEIPVDKITSIGFRQKRNLVMGIPGTAGGLFAAGFLVSYSSEIGGTEMFIGLLVCLVIILGGIANLIGHHEIQIGIGGSKTKKIKVEMSKTKDGIEFVNSIRKAMKR